MDKKTPALMEQAHKLVDDLTEDEALAFIAYLAEISGTQDS